MAKKVTKKSVRSRGGLDQARSVKSPPKSGSVKSAVVERAVKKVANRRAGSAQSSSSDYRVPKS
jgi:hypothetical protein